MRSTFISLAIVLITVCSAAGQNTAGGFLLPGSSDAVTLWSASSGSKIKPDSPAPQDKQDAIRVRAARNEAEAVQLVIRPAADLTGLSAAVDQLRNEAGEVLAADAVEILRVDYVTTTQATDDSTTVGEWPDPLPPLKGTLDLKAGRNQPLWIRVSVPREAPAGRYSGKILLKAGDYAAAIPLHVEVYDFTLPERASCTSAFGFSASDVFDYHGLKDKTDKRLVLDKYLASFAAHRISPYDPTPLDSIRVTWPKVSPPPSRFKNWDNLRIVTNEAYEGDAAIVIFDDDKTANSTVTYNPLIAIPKGGLKLSFAWRNALPDDSALVTLNHYDANGNWMSGRNRDIPVQSGGHWKEFSETFTEFPEGACSVRLHLRATRWQDDGLFTGLTWFDHVSLKNAGTGEELIIGGDFETVRRTELLAPAETLRPVLDFGAWDKAMSRAIDYYHFNSFQLNIPGMGGGTYHEIIPPELLGFTEDDPEYAVLFESYCRQIQQHLDEKGWTDEAFIYWFDEPDPHQYEFVKHGFDKLKRACPKISRMLTEQPEPPLFGGPNIYCVISYLYQHAAAQQRRAEGDRFWWYICCGPKTPYCTLFIDHPGTELRAWLWQTWERNIEGILIWQTNYWTSSAAYPDAAHPQNPYQDPMSWTSGYSTPAGRKLPWGNGDGRFIYPPAAAADGKPTSPVLDGPVDSIRWEMLRDGVEDYEYLTMLKKLLTEKKGSLDKTVYEQYAELLTVPESISKDLTHFTTDPTTIEAQRHKIAQAIEQLQKR